MLSGAHTGRKTNGSSQNSVLRADFPLLSSVLTPASTLLLEAQVRRFSFCVILWINLHPFVGVIEREAGWRLGADLVTFQLLQLPPPWGVVALQCHRGSRSIWFSTLSLSPLFPLYMWERNSHTLLLPLKSGFGRKKEMSFNVLSLFILRGKI